MSDEGTSAGKKPTGYIYTVVERAEGKPIWYRIGAAWLNKDGSLNGSLAALPVNGRIHIRAPADDENDESPPGAEGE